MNRDFDDSSILYNVICKSIASEKITEDYSSEIDNFKEWVTTNKSNSNKNVKDFAKNLFKIIPELEPRVDAFSKDTRPFAAIIKHHKIKGEQVGGALMTVLLYFLLCTQAVSYMMEVYNRINGGAADRYIKVDRLLTFLTTIIGLFTGTGWLVIFFKLIVGSIGRMMLANAMNGLGEINGTLTRKINVFIGLIPGINNVNRHVRFTFVLFLTLVIKIGFVELLKVTLPAIGVGDRFVNPYDIPALADLPYPLPNIVIDRGIHQDVFNLAPALIGMIIGANVGIPTRGVGPLPVGFDRFRLLFHHIGDIAHAIADDRAWSEHMFAIGRELILMGAEGVRDGAINALELTRDTACALMPVFVSDIYILMARGFQEIRYHLRLTLRRARILYMQQQGGAKDGKVPNFPNFPKSAKAAKQIDNVLKMIIKDVEYLSKAALKINYSDIITDCHKLPKSKTKRMTQSIQRMPKSKLFYKKNPKSIPIAAIGGNYKKNELVK